MSVKSKSDIANSAIRIFLQTAGQFYDDVRGYPRFSKHGKAWDEVIKLFSNSCCYCGGKLTPSNTTEDHLIPINKNALGLHAWGNLVPCCHECNREKNSKDWLLFLRGKNKGKALKKRIELITRFQRKYKYNPKINLSSITGNLYEDIGEVADLLIRLRLRQAETLIKRNLR